MIDKNPESKIKRGSASQYFLFITNNGTSFLAAQQRQCQL